MFHFIEAFTHVMIILYIFFKILTKTGQDLHKKFRTDQHFLMIRTIQKKNFKWMLLMN